MVTEEKRRRSPRINYVKRVEYWKGKQYQKGVEQAKVEAHKRKPIEESAREHIGKFIDSLKGSDAVNVALYASLAYLSYEAFGIPVNHPADTFATQEDKDAEILKIGNAIVLWTKANPGKSVPDTLMTELHIAQNGTVGPHVSSWTEIVHDPKMALVGPLGLKLATSMGGTPPVSQLTGLATLATLGLVSSNALSAAGQGLEELIAAFFLEPLWGPQLFK